MTARFVYWMNVSLDLRIEHAVDEDGGGTWMRISPTLHEEFNRRAQGLTMMVQGRRVYDTMEAYWPAARDDESLPEVMRRYGEIWTSAPKVLVSHTRTTAGHNTRVINTDAITALADLKAESTGDIGVGGATIATQLLHAGLLDELLLFTHPAILGSGRPLFDHVDSPVQCDLLEQQTYGGGVTLHRYAIRPR